MHPQACFHGCTNLDWCQAALVEWYVPGDQAAQAVDDGRIGHSWGGVQVAVHLRTGASKVKRGTAVTPFNSECKRYTAAIRANRAHKGWYKSSQPSCM